MKLLKSFLGVRPFSTVTHSTRQALHLVAKMSSVEKYSPFTPDKSEIYRKIHKVLIPVSLVLNVEILRN